MSFKSIQGRLSFLFLAFTVLVLVSVGVTFWSLNAQKVDGVVINELWKHVLSRGIPWCEAGWILEDNPAVSNFTERLGFTRYKIYRLYERAL